jgi:hypothetical protein
LFRKFIPRTIKFNAEFHETHLQSRLQV